MKDWRGTEVEVGSIVVYPVRGGSHMHMAEGIVTELQLMTADRWDWNQKKMVPTEVGVVKVRRTLTSGYVGDVIEDDGKRYWVGIYNPTVVG